ncbi:MAG TPA: GNAT family N-acetyltransferase [Nocardioides sp.]|uniref:GNAT family N-acetyltransferase n=1 Tax=Nocardioides sp. TaxID=35761 RepID=UPI002D805A53|nr:GNAT family N-acetyltransferase [Nocardioides sp.]HET6651505.1 GNAT family N-acetyltransferase [Nocardioides sp.]
MDLTLRPLLTDDIPLLARHLAAVEAVDNTGEHYNEDDLVEEFANPDIEVGKDIVGGFDGDDLVGYFAVYPRSTDDSYQKVHVEGSVNPARRGEGIGTRLVEAMLARADEVHAEKHPDLPAKYNVTGLSANAAQEELLAAFEMVPERWNFVMRTRLDDVPEPPAVPEGLSLVKYSAELDRAMLEAHNAAFVDHPNFTPWTDVMWKQWVSDSRNFRPELSLLVVEDVAPDRVVAYLQSNEFDAYFQATGRREAYVAKVGTRREHRGRGLAGLLLAHALVLYKQAGFDEASLDVDSENPTGALGIYERAGFEVESRWTNYALHREPVLG